MYRKLCQIKSSVILSPNTFLELSKIYFCLLQILLYSFTAFFSRYATINQGKMATLKQMSRACAVLTDRQHS